MDAPHYNMNVMDVGAMLAKAHQQTSPTDFLNRVFLDGHYLNIESRKLNMPFYSEIDKALEKTEQIVMQITANIPYPFVNLQNWYTMELEEAYYGNPMWDIGAVIVALNNSSKAEEFLQHYIKSGGVLITIIELYIGILYVKLNEAIANGNINKWRHFAKNECSNIINGNMVTFDEISAEALSNAGLPGLART